jgi:hypothetical protein
MIDASAVVADLPTGTVVPVQRQTRDRGVSGLCGAGRVFLEGFAQVPQRGHAFWTVGCRIDPASYRAVSLASGEQIDPVHDERRRASEATPPSGLVSVDDTHRERRLRQSDVIEGRSEQRRCFASTGALRDHQ